MEGHIQDILYAIGTVFTVWAVMQKGIKDMETRINQRFDAIDKRFDAIDERLARIEQNHLDHISTLHAYPIGNIQPEATED